MPIIRSPSNWRCSLWFPYECGGGSVLSSGRFVSGVPTNKPTFLNTFRPLLCPSSGARQTVVAASGFRMNVEVEVFSAVVGLLVGAPLTNRPRLRTLPPPHSYGNQRLQRQFDGFLMMGIIMAETCWPVSVQQSKKILQLIVTSSWVFYLITCKVCNKNLECCSIK